MKEEYKTFIFNNEYIFTQPTKVDPMMRDLIYKMYNETFNDNRQPNGCGRCWSTVKNNLYTKYKQEL